MAHTGRPQPGTFRDRARQHQLAELAQVSDDDKIKLIEDAGRYRQFVQELREYNTLRTAAQEKGIRAVLVREPALPGDGGTELHEFIANMYSDGLGDGQDYEEQMSRGGRAAQTTGAPA